MAFKPLDRSGIAARIAQDIPEGWFVNLGIGIPTAVSDHVPLEREVIFHSENGVIGAGPAPDPDKVNPYLVNAGTQHITLRTGGSFVHHADSFAIARGGHLDLCVLGAFEVAQNGDIANWMVPGKMVKGMGGAMDLVAGVPRVGILMEHTAKGEAKILKSCNLPLTGKGVVSKIITDLAVFEVDKTVTPSLKLVAHAPDVTIDEIKAKTEAAFTVALQG